MFKSLISGAARAIGCDVVDSKVREAERAELRRLADGHAHARAKVAALKARLDQADPDAARIAGFQAGLIARIAADAGRPHDPRVTVVVTSCDRHDLLVKTLDSFFRHNTHPETEVLVVEDGDRELEPAGKARFSDRPIRWISTGARRGQIKAVDFAYGHVTTPYIFHLEDDWLFERPGFIEKSMAILKAEPLCLQVWIRGFYAENTHPVLPEPLVSDGVEWRKVAYGWQDVWHGFSFNPGLRRLRDYQLIGGSYAAVVQAALDRAGNSEAALSDLYRRIGFYAGILWDEDRRGYVRHKGRGRQVRPPAAAVS